MSRYHADGEGDPNWARKSDRKELVWILALHALAGGALYLALAWVAAGDAMGYGTGILRIAAYGGWTVSLVVSLAFWAVRAIWKRI